MNHLSFFLLQMTKIQLNMIIFIAKVIAKSNHKAEIL